MIEITGRYESPIIGVARNPAGMHGDGALHVGPQGVRIVGTRNPTGMISAFGCLGAIVGFALTGAVLFVTREYGVPDFVVRIVGGAVFFGALFGGLLFGRRVGKPKPIDVVLPWDDVKSPELVGLSLSFLSKAPPKGVVTFQSRDTATLERVASMIRARRFEG